MRITYRGDPADLTLSPGDTLVLHKGARITSRTALSVTYTGGPASLTFDPSVIGSPTQMTARRLRKGVSAHDAKAGALTPSRPSVTASVARRVGAITASPFRRVTP